VHAHCHNDKFVFLLYILLFQKNDITKFLWGDLRASPPKLFGCGGDRPQRLHAVGDYDLRCLRQIWQSEKSHFGVMIKSTFDKIEYGDLSEVFIAL